MTMETIQTPKRRLPLGRAALVWFIALAVVIVSDRLRPVIERIGLGKVAQFASFAG